MAGETISVQPLIRDRLGNPTAAPEGALKVSLETPDGKETSMAPVLGSRGGLTTYDVNYSPEQKGWHTMHVALADNAVEGSPVRFRVIPGLPAIATSRMELPKEPEMEGIKLDKGSRGDAELLSVNLIAGRMYRLLVVAVDRCGNELDRGGANVTARVTSIAGVAPPKNQDNSFVVEDNKDGTYVVELTYKNPADLKVVVAIDKPAQPVGLQPLDKGGAQGAAAPCGGEFPPLVVTLLRADDQLIKKKQQQDAQAALQRQDASKSLLTEAASPSKPAAAEEVVDEGSGGEEDGE